MAMSVASSGRKSLLSTLSSMKKSPRKVRFQLPTDLKSIVGDLTNKENIKAYEELVGIIRDSEIEDRDLSTLLQRARENISLLTPSVHHLVQVIVRVKWLHRSNAAAEEFQGFLVELLSAHNYYTKMVLDELILAFKSEDELWECGGPSDDAKVTYDRVHEVLEVLIHVIPMSFGVLKETIEAQFPYLRRSSEEHEKYIYNMFRILEYLPHLRTDFLFLIINKLIIVDVNSPKQEISKAECEDERDEQFEMDIEDDMRMRHPLANTLDSSLSILYRYVYVTCHDMSVSPSKLKLEETKNLFQDIVNVFDNLILPTHGTHHVQFILFYICSFHSSLADTLLTSLWQKVTSPRVVCVVRQAAVAYVSGLLTRASYVSLKVLIARLSDMVAWIHNYISNQDGVECPHADIKVHPVFYSVCQAVFYIISCRYREFVNAKKGLLFLEGLNLTKIVTCSLNPLKVCLPIIVQNFAAIARNYQLAYCYTIIEHNSRTTLPVIRMNEGGLVHDMPEKEVLDAFFPFDPYILKKSGHVISDIYRDYQPPEKEEDVGSRDEEDDFLSGYYSKTPPASTLGLSLSPSF